MEKQEARIPIKNFKQFKEQSVEDLLRIAEFITKAAEEVKEGDISQVDYILGKLDLWRQMLFIRHNIRWDEFNAQRDIADDPEFDLQVKTP